MGVNSYTGILTCFLGTAMSVTGLQAASIIDQETGLALPGTTVVDFGVSQFPVGTIVETQFDGVSFGSSYAYNNTPDVYDALADGYLENADFTNEPGSIFFDGDVTAANFSWRTIRNTQTTFSAYNDDILVETFTADTNVSLIGGRYFGFENILFDEIRLTIAHSGNNSFTLDNLEYVSAIPLPAAAWLFGSGLLGLIGLSWRRR